MDYAEMKKALDIVDYIGRYTLLRQLPSGEYVGLCPLHHERTPSFFVNREKQQFVCMGCGIGGDIITFIEAYHKVKFNEAIQILQFETGVDPSSPKEILEAAKKFKKKEESPVERYFLLENCMDEFPEFHEIKEWMDEGISIDVLTKYNVRYNKERDRIYFPIWDINGRIVAVKYRNLYTQPKYCYVNKIGKKDFLYNLNFAKQHILKSDECIVFEGEKSVLKMETWGIHNSVAAGTHFIKGEVQSLIMLPFGNIVFAYDQDVDVKEIKAQVGLLKHYKNIYYIPTNLLGEKESPCDRGYDFWMKLYESRLRLT